MNNDLNKINFEIENLIKKNDFSKIYKILSNQNTNLIKDIDLLKIFLISSYITKKFDFFLLLTKEIVKRKILDREIVFILIYIFISLNKFEDTFNLLNNFIKKDIEKSEKIKFKFISKFMLIKNLTINFEVKKEVNTFLLFGIYLRKAELINESIEVFEILINEFKNNYIAFFHLAKNYQKIKKNSKALININLSLEINPNLEDAINSKAVILIELKKYNEAYDFLKKKIISNKTNKYYFMNLGKILADRGEFNEAIIFFDKALSIDNEHPIANYGKALCLLSKGKIQQSFKYLNFRMNGYLLSNNFLNKFNKPRLKNFDNLKNIKILVIFEQGFGDTLQFSRYLVYLVNMGATVYFIPQKKLYNIFNFLNKKIKVFTYDDKIPLYDFYLPLFDLPFLYYSKYKKFENYKPYLNISKLCNSKLENLLNNKKINVGICWKSNLDSHNKSFDLKYFDKISKIKNINLISLQLDDEDDIKKVNFKVTTLSQMGIKNNFYNTAIFMKSLDLVITCDTSICHLSGSFEINTWLLLKKIPDWRWLINNQIWYKNFTLFHQKNEFDWSDVFNSVYNKLIKIYN
ncbi:hypothetical protein OAP76_06475 [Alphaproteobacteria bacterium]|nr:hypothetical protein [Alphaproteobacteria bacterium]